MPFFESFGSASCGNKSIDTGGVLYLENSQESMGSQRLISE